MPTNNEYKKLNKHDDQNTEDESGGCNGTSGGRIEFREFIGGRERLRDDLLPLDERKRLLAVHKNINEQNVKKQKEHRDQYKNLKESKTQLKDFRQGLAENRSETGYKPHAILANKAQFSGIDRQVNALPNEQIAETNNEKREELRYQYNLQHRPQYAHAPKATPKPTPFNR